MAPSVTASTRCRLKAREHKMNRYSGILHEGPLNSS